MKTHKHGNGMTHEQVIKFSNRLAYNGYHSNSPDSFSRGWNEACKYFAHELRVQLRFYERINEL